MIEIGITADGNAAFFIRDLSKTIDGVALLRESEKKFQTRRPVKRK
jgi:hypothetical protein